MKSGVNGRGEERAWRGDDEDGGGGGGREWRGRERERGKKRKDLAKLRLNVTLDV